MALKSCFKRKLIRLAKAIYASIGEDHVSSDLLPSIFAVFSYCWQRPSHRYHDGSHFLDYKDNGKF